MQSEFKTSQFSRTTSMNTAILVVKELGAAEGFRNVVEASFFLHW